jgi:hypothetical protein
MTWFIAGFGNMLILITSPDRLSRRSRTARKIGSGGTTEIKEEMNSPKITGFHLSDRKSSVTGREIDKRMKKNEADD